MSQHKFSIPILPTLITNFYTPAPVIYPPGSDPKVMDQTSSSSSVSVSMDADPCVVALLRNEVVVEKVDLTPSEHAGVALSEHATKVSTTSTTSTVVAPQTLNNVVVTKPETKTDDFMTSDSAKAFMKHMEGKIDSKTTQMVTGSSTINQETPSPVASVILDQEGQKNQELHNITQNVIVSTVTEQEASSSVASDTLYQQMEALDDSLYVCAIPPPGQYYKKIAMVEVDESLLKEPAPVKHSVQKKLKISEKTTIPIEESNSAVTEKNTVWCEKIEKVPKLPSTVVEPVTTPLTNNLKVVNPNVCNFVWCELCGINCNTRAVFNQHIAGKKHQKKLKRTASEDKVVIMEGNKRKASGSISTDEGADTKRPKTDQEGGGGDLVTCNVCNVGCYGFTAYKLHRAGSAHIAMALKQAAGGSMGKV